MIDELLEEWAELQEEHPREVGAIQKKINQEIHIAESLHRAGYTGELNGFSLQFIVQDRQRVLREMNDRLKQILD